MIWNHGFQHNAKRLPHPSEEPHGSDKSMLKDHTHTGIAVTFSYTLICFITEPEDGVRLIQMDVERKHTYKLFVNNLIYLMNTL